MNSKQILEILDKQWLSIKDIQIIANCGRDKAKKIKKTIEEQLKDWYLPKGQVPSKILADYLKIDINYLKKFSK